MATRRPTFAKAETKVTEQGCSPLNKIIFQKVEGDFSELMKQEKVVSTIMASPVSNSAPMRNSI
jgi:hypothetical protein